jgi:dihydrofolate reductase
MLADGLVDELHLFMYPVALGSGERLFPEGGAETKFELGGSDSYSNGVIHMDYRPVR